jgi:DNA mismatch repair ATPase MutS
MKEFFDPSIAPELCVPSSLTLTNPTSHAMLTGPNKGGKSSSLRALCLNVWLAQTFGLVFAKSARLTPFAWIQSGLRLADSPGTESMFEKEILFGVSTLRLAKSGRPGIVFYDECFHSTNPPDGEKTARIFLESLWSYSNVVSLVSTHIFSLVESAPSSIQRLCVPAEKTPTGIVYSFELAPGICKVSSVEEIYKKFGFPLVSPRSNLKLNLIKSNRTD